MRAKWSVRAASLNFGEREVPLRKLGDETISVFSTIITKT